MYNWIRKFMLKCLCQRQLEILCGAVKCKQSQIISNDLMI